MRMRLLVAEDDGAVRTFVDRVLRRAGFDVVTASDGERALQCDEQHGPFDLYLLDVVMPRIGGGMVARRVRERDPAARVLFFSGYAEVLPDDSAVPDGAFLAKPVTMRALIGAVTALLEAGPP